MAWDKLRGAVLTKVREGRDRGVLIVGKKKKLKQQDEDYGWTD